jgi:hypothetical protein
LTAQRAISPAHALGAAALLTGPTVLAFFSGGFFDRPRLWAALVACGLVLLVALTVTPPLPRPRAARLALAGVVALAVLSGLSSLWAASAGPALDDAQRLIAYAGVLIAGSALLRPRELARAVEPAVALGALIVVGYGLAERVLPGVIELSSSASGGGRLEQPLTYWNAMGALAALGLTACGRLTGDPTRPRRLATAAAAATPVLAAGLYLTFSRGALVAVFLGFGLLLAIAPDRAQGRALVVCLAAGAVACVFAALLPGVRHLDEAAGTREAGGAALGVALTFAAAGAGLALGGARKRTGGALSRRTLAAAYLTVLVAVAFAVGVTSAENPPAAQGARSARLASLESNRYSYWRVAIESFADNPLAGAGAGGFRYEWRLRRDLPEAVRDAHSLYLETAAELGLAGLAALALFLGGIAACAVAVRRSDPLLAAGPAALVGTWAGACALDWHWEMPAVTLPALLAAGALLARADALSALSREDRPAARATRPDQGWQAGERDPGEHDDGDLRGVPEARQPEAERARHSDDEHGRQQHERRPAPGA